MSRRLPALSSAGDTIARSAGPSVRLAVGDAVVVAVGEQRLRSTGPYGLDLRRDREVALAEAGTRRVLGRAERRLSARPPRPVHLIATSTPELINAARPAPALDVDLAALHNGETREPRPDDASVVSLAMITVALLIPVIKRRTRHKPTPVTDQPHACELLGSHTALGADSHPSSGSSPATASSAGARARAERGKVVTVSSAGRLVRSAEQ